MMLELTGYMAGYVLICLLAIGTGMAATSHRYYDTLGRPLGFLLLVWISTLLVIAGYYYLKTFTHYMTSM